MKNHGLFCLLTVALSTCCIAGAADIKQNKSGGIIDQSVLNEPQSNLPDERILWRLFHAKKYKQLSLQVKQLRQQYPEWLPLTDLTNALQKLRTSSKSTAKTTHSSHKKVITYHDPCSSLSSRWSSAEAYLKSGQPSKAVDIYNDLIVECPDKNRIQILEKARLRLDYKNFNQLLELSSHYLPSMYLDRIKYAALKDRYLGNKQPNSEEQKLAVTGIADLVQLFKDDNLAAVIGWRYFDLKEYEKAQDWFQKAILWNSKNENAHYGQILSLENAGEFDQALAIYLSVTKPSSQIKSVAARILKAKAWQNFDRNQLRQAAENVSQAQKINDSDPEIQELRAWIAKQSGQYDKAAKLFDELYQQSPGRKYARAYIQSQVQVNRSLLARKAEQAGSELLDEYNQFHGQELYDRKQFQSAYKLVPDTFPKLEHIDSPSVDGGGYVRYKSGENGLGRLDLFKAPVATGSYTVNGNHTFNLSLSRVQLYSGSPDKCVAPVGILPGSLVELSHGKNQDQSTIQTISDFCAKPFSPTKQLNDAVEIDFSYRKDGWFSPFVKLGSTPIGGIINPAVTFDAGFIHQTGFGNWELEAYSQPVRQSILSYTGIKDPYGPNGGIKELDVLAKFLGVPVSAIPAAYGAPLTAISKGLEWGRVLRTGISPSIFYRFNDNWNTSLSVDLALLEGKNVAPNNSVSVSANFSRNLHISGFNYFSVGPSINYQHYNKNLSYFTYGHGGYFSPDQYINVGSGINFLTEEGKAYVIKGRAIGGFQDITNSSASWFPLGNQAADSYGATHSSGVAFDFELKGVWLISPNFQLGAGSAIRKTNGYDDYTGGLFVRYYFDSRKASFSTDIPASMFSSIY
jgi:tetratricopeptide (TPR) repeat protein